MSKYTFIAQNARFICIVAGVCLGGFGSVFASQTYEDIVVSMESYSTDQSFHGYAEYRALVTNKSETRTHRITLFAPFNAVGYGDHISRITRSVVLSPSSSANVSILQPALSMNGQGLGVVIDGSTQREPVRLDTSSHCQYSFPYYYGSSGRNPLCILLSRGVSYDDFHNGVEKAFPSPSGRRSSSSSSEMWHFIRSESPVRAWSSTWLAYSRYDGIVLTLSDMQAVPALVKSALLQYVQCGGSLLVLGPWEKPEVWKSRDTVSGPLRVNYIHFGVCVVSETPNVTSWEKNTWERLKSDIWGPSASVLQKKASVADANKQFPIIADLTVPVRGLFLLVLIFAVTIGPVNLFVLSRKKRRIWMLWTVPVVSIVASLAIFVYAFIAEGWKGYIRTESITILDDNTHMATTIGVNAFYCPLTPRGGLHYDYETEVTPISIEQWQGGRSRTIDWTNDQHLVSGWIAARVPAHFLLRKSQMRRERLKISRNQENQISVLNGLGADIRQLWFADEDGKIHTAENVKAGTKMDLVPSSDSILSGNRDNIWRKSYSSIWTRSADQITKDPKRYLRANCYMAVLDDSVFVEQALQKLKSKSFQSIVFGILKGSLDAG